METNLPSTGAFQELKRRILASDDEKLMGMLAFLELSMNMTDLTHENMKKASVVLTNQQEAIVSLGKLYEELNRQIVIMDEILEPLIREVRALQTEINMLQANTLGRH